MISVTFEFTYYFDVMRDLIYTTCHDMSAQVKSSLKVPSVYVTDNVELACKASKDRVKGVVIVVVNEKEEEVSVPEDVIVAWKPDFRGCLAAALEAYK